VSERAAVVLCVHHKPWLVMSTFITLVLQEHQDVDVYVLYNLGDGTCPDRAAYEPYRRFSEGHRPDPAIERQSYGGYDRLARQSGLNSKLSPFDERVRAATRLRRAGVHYLELENDHALDSGAYYKFLKTGLWTRYDRVLFLAEGTLFTRPTSLGAGLAFAARHDVDFLAAGHFKRRLPRSAVLHGSAGEPGAMPIDGFHDRMIARTFEIFRRDPDFDRVFERWTDEVVGTTENHLPNIWGSAGWRRLRNAADSRAVLPSTPLRRLSAKHLREHRGVFPRLGVVRARARVAATRRRRSMPRIASRGAEDMIYVDCALRRLGDVASVSELQDVKFYSVKEPEWFGVNCNHQLSRRFTERLVDRMDRYRLWDVLDVPFAGTALEPLWGLMPEWLGAEKWFFDGLHRVFKNPATNRREDEPAELADYVNRYYPGRVAVGWRGDFLKVRDAAAPYLARLRAELDGVYW
jgi:hypothetical protein